MTMTTPTDRLYTTTGLVVVASATTAASLAAAPGIAGLLGAALALVVLAIAIIDARQFIIPDELTIAAVLLGLVHAVVVAPSGSRVECLGLALVRGFILAACFLMLREAYRRLRGRRGLGLGDVKLSVAAGVWLDFEFIPIAIEMAALSAIAVYLGRQLVLRRPVTTTARLPFGLFFAPAIWLAWLIETVLLSA
jgi:leader peptidase (prepilin peptidase)/N-methyltransferase